MLIGELSKRSGLSRDTIRYYEKLMLLAAANRNVGNDYKNYGYDALERLHHIQQLKDIGFTLREIRQLLAGGGNHHPCRDLPLQLTQKIENIDEKIAALLDFKSSLIKMQRACNGACGILNGIPACVPEVDASKQSSKCC